MTDKAQVSVFIPTYNRGSAVFTVLEKIEKCNPCPIEIIIHIDQADGVLEAELTVRFSKVKVLTSPVRLGPGGGRHRCLLECRAPYAVSFDDDSYPIDTDFFGRVEQLFSRYPNAAILGASIWHRHEAERPRVETAQRSASYVGCGFAVRPSAYHQTRGFLPRAVSYGIEELDLSLQLFAAGWDIYEVGDLRVFHDTDLAHHTSVQINAGTITNTGLFVFLHYPFSRWGWGLLTVLNRVAFSIRAGRLRGILSGLLGVPVECYRHSRYRNVIPWSVLSRFRELRRAADHKG